MTESQIMNQQEFLAHADRLLDEYRRRKGVGIARASKKHDKRPPSRRAAKAHATAVKAARKRQFKWMFLTGGMNPPRRNAWGVP